MPDLTLFTVEDNTGHGRRAIAEEISIKRKFLKYTMVWNMCFEELVQLHTIIGKYIAGEREKRG